MVKKINIILIIYTNLSVQKSQALRDKEEKILNEKVEYEKHLRELNDKV